VRRTEHREALHLPAIEQLASYQTSLHRLADADVVGDQQAHWIELERHEEWDQLVRPRLDSYVPERPERSSTVAEAKPDRLAKKPTGAVVAHLGWVRQLEIGGLDLLERRPDARDFVLSPAKRTEHEEGPLTLGQNHPFATAGTNQ
jgi:hypothetical protein